ncbi:MAG: hypothetical protein Q9217_002666 [Psora testacea]
MSFASEEDLQRLLAKKAHFRGNAPLDETVKKDIREDYANSRNFCDGDIFRYLRECDLRDDKRGKKKWLARLSQCKRKDVLQLFDREELGPLLTAFDELLPLIGFWPALQIGTFHRLLSLKCPEELRHYLQHIRVCWADILRCDIDVRSFVDYHTVESLQMRTPRLSTTDKDFITDCMHREIIFPEIKDNSIRARILKNISHIDYMIPSLYTFFEDTKWLEPCSKILRSVFVVNRKRSIRQALKAAYEGDEQDNIWCTLNRDLSVSEWPGSTTHAVDSGIRQLWMFAWRYFPELSAILPRKDAGKRNPHHKVANEECWRKFAEAALQLGFGSPVLAKIRSQDSDSRMARTFIYQARPEEYYEVDDEQVVSRIANLLKTIKQKSPWTDNALSTSPEDEVPIRYRCGRPQEHSHERAKRLFYPIDIYSRQLTTVSDFCVHRDIFIAFFGREHYLQLAVGVDQAPTSNKDVNTRMALEQINFINDPIQGPVFNTGQRPITPRQLLTPVNQRTREQRENHSTVANGQSSNTIVINENMEGDMQLQTQTVDDQQAAAVLEAEPIDDNVEMVERPHDPPISQPMYIKVSHYKEWAREAAEGSLFVMDVHGGSWSVCSPELATSEAFLKDMASRFSKSYFAVGDKQSKGMKCITPEKIHLHRKSSEHDGVLYIFEKRPKRTYYEEAVTGRSAVSGLASTKEKATEAQVGFELITKKDTEARVGFESITKKDTESRVHYFEWRPNTKPEQWVPICYARSPILRKAKLANQAKNIEHVQQVVKRTKQRPLADHGPAKFVHDERDRRIEETAGVDAQTTAISASEIVRTRTSQLQAEDEEL